MDPTISGALVGVAAGSIGFAAAAWQTRATLRANREAARDQRLWEKRSALYEALLRATGDLTTKTATARDLEAVIGALHDQRTLVLAYASDAVLFRYMTTISNLTRIKMHSDAGGANGQLASEINDLTGVIRDELQQERRRPQRRRLSVLN